MAPSRNRWNCIACDVSKRSRFDIEVKDFAVHTELAGPEVVDLTPFMREDILLNLPPYPHCDREGGRVCPAPEAIKKVARGTPAGLERARGCCRASAGSAPDASL